MLSDACIIDGYVDEPACLGVPPYISPYVRTVAGVLLEKGFTPDYFTIDQVRLDPYKIFKSEYSLLVVIAGTTVPGKYIGGTPANLNELRQIGDGFYAERKVLCGPVTLGHLTRGGEKATKLKISGFDAILPSPPDIPLSQYLEGQPITHTHSYESSDRWSVLGAEIIRKHPSFPDIMCELETARGCHRYYSGCCSFCTEIFYGPPHFRRPDAVFNEVKALYENGGRHFRLGRQPDLLTYGSLDIEFPEPRPDMLYKLFRAVRYAAPSLLTLHIDNINPGTIARHPEKSEEALNIIIKYHTTGDVAAFGLESADPVVIEKNNLVVTPEEVLSAIELVNRTGGVLRNGIPELLPGINFICGLYGETSETYRKNRDFLNEIKKRGLILRRINIRQLVPFEGTRAYEKNNLHKFKNEFFQFKEFVNRQIDHYMVEKVFPLGTCLKSVIIEKNNGISFGRQLGSYPILVGIPVSFGLKEKIDVVVVSWGARSITALPIPININLLPSSALRWLPGISDPKLAAIERSRPFQSLEDLQKVTGMTPLDKHYSFKLHESQ